MLKKIRVPITGEVHGTISNHQEEGAAKLSLVLGVEMLVNAKSQHARLHLHIAEPPDEHGNRFFLLLVRNGVEPDLRGPYETDERRDYAAKTLGKHPADAAFALDIDAAGYPLFTMYCADFFEEGAPA